MQRVTPRADSGRLRAQRSKTVAHPTKTTKTTKTAKKKNGRSGRAHALAADALDKRELLAVLAAFRRGDFSARLPEHDGVDGKIADTLNDLIELHARLAAELRRLSRVVGEEGRTGQRATLGGVHGAWADSVDSVNSLIVNLVHPTSETARVIGAVSLGDLSQTMALDLEGRPLRGEFLGTAKTVNTMVAQLAKFSGMLQGQKDLLEQSQLLATELQNQQEELRQTNQQLEEKATQLALTSNYESGFLATLSHELRTPLQAMLSWGRILREDTSDPELLARGLAAIERSASAQQKLIDDLLDVSRIVTGKLRLEHEPVALASVIRAAFDEARTAGEAKGLELGAELDEGLPLLSGDAQRLQQVVGNLLSNAIQFTPRGGRVQVRLRRNRDHAEICVIDSGEGIESEFLPYVFERFRQADSTSTRSHTGLGIGLVIVRHLVEMHGGTVCAGSAGKGRGAAFVALLPLREIAAVLERQPAGAVVPSGHADSLRGLRVLLVDDMDETRECVAMILRRRGAEVTSVASVQAAFSVLAEAKPDVLVSDIAMPGRDGVSLIQALRGGAEGEAGARIPAVALSAYARPEERQRALSAGFDMHLSKPVREETLVSGVLALARLGADASAARGL